MDPNDTLDEDSETGRVALNDADVASDWCAERALPSVDVETPLF
jgi:hypothetical protein